MITYKNVLTTCPYLHKARFARGKGQFFAFDFKQAAELPDPEYPFLLTTGHIKRGVVFIAFHWAEAAANVLTNDALNPVTKTPEYKVCAVKIEVA